jgi:hypothetical protein
MRTARHNYRLLLLAMAFAPLTGSALAQMSPQMSFPTQKQQKQLTPEQQKYQKELDDSYKAASKKIPDKNPTDPWADIRPTTTVPPSKKKQQ